MDKNIILSSVNFIGSAIIWGYNPIYSATASSKLFSSGFAITIHKTRSVIATINKINP